MKQPDDLSPWCASDVLADSSCMLVLTNTLTREVGS